MIPTEKTPTDQFVSDADAFYAEAMAIMDGVPGVAITVVKDGKTLYQKGFGYANVEQQQAFTPQTSYYIASCTKAFTALMAMQLDQQGTIPLNSKLVDYFPQVDFPDQVPLAQVTIRDLLTHTSGLDADPISFRLAYTGEHSFQELIDLLPQIRVNKVGYGNFQYTNQGYNLYGMIVEQVTGQPWQDMLAKTVLHPLEMKRTTAYISEAERQDWTLAMPYQGADKHTQERLYLRKRDNTMQSAGGMITTAEDMAQWLKVQLGKGQVDGRQLIGAERIGYTHERLAKSNMDREPFSSEAYGMGWHIGTYRGQEVIWHFGGFPGAMTHISFLPEAGIGVAIFSNEAAAGLRLINLFATYAYDYALEGSEQTNSAYREKVQELRKSLDERYQKYQQGVAERAKRTWQLSKPFADYSGTYVNKKYGTVRVKGDQKGIFVEMGNLHAQATPYTEAESIRVEMIPRSGSVIQFVWEGQEIQGIELMGDFYEKEQS